MASKLASQGLKPVVEEVSKKKSLSLQQIPPKPLNSQPPKAQASLDDSIDSKYFSPAQTQEQTDAKGAKTSEKDKPAAKEKPLAPEPEEGKGEDASTPILSRHSSDKSEELDERELRKQQREAKKAASSKKLAKKKEEAKRKREEKAAKKQQEEQAALQKEPVKDKQEPSSKAQNE